MTFLNEVEGKNISKGDYSLFLKLIAPFAPHVVEELWSLSGNKKSIHLEKWPQADKSKLVSSTVTIAMQVNGKTRGTVIIPTDSEQPVAQTAAESDTTIGKYLERQKVVRVIFIKNRLINFVLVQM